MEKYTRLCPKCGRIIEHTKKYNRDSAEKRNQFCRKCGCNRPDRLEKQRKLFSKDKNPFWGKKHSDKTLAKLKQRKLTEEQISLLKSGVCARSGKENGMYGRSVYSVWYEKYGKEEADRRQLEMSRKKSEWMKNNYDPKKHKCPPHGCGNGWGGWYKGWYFRSLLELSYMIKVIEKRGLEWKSGENTSISIFYQEDGKKRRYFPDFLIGKKMIEVKPEKLIHTQKNILKRIAAEKYCFENGLEYEITNVPIIDFEEIVSLVNEKVVVFDKKSKQKFEKEKLRFNKKTEMLKSRKEYDGNKRNVD